MLPALHDPDLVKDLASFVKDTSDDWSRVCFPPGVNSSPPSMPGLIPPPAVTLTTLPFLLPGQKPEGKIESSTPDSPSAQGLGGAFLRRTITIPLYQVAIGVALVAFHLPREVAVGLCVGVLLFAWAENSQLRRGMWSK